MTDVEQVVRDAILEVAPLPPTEAMLSRSSLLHESLEGAVPALELDSLSTLELVAMLEDALGIEIIDAMDPAIVTVGDLVDLCTRIRHNQEEKHGSQHL